MLCFGATGSGTSTLAVVLGERMGLPVTLIDDLCWDPGWTKAPADEQLHRVLPAIHADEWVLDSLWSSYAAHAWGRVDAIVALDYPRHVSLARLARRTCRRIRTRESVCNGNVETLPRTLSSDSIIAWHFRSWASKRERMRRWHADASAPPVLLLRRPAEADALLAQLGRGQFHGTRSTFRDPVRRVPLGRRGPRAGLKRESGRETPVGRRFPVDLLRLEGCPRQPGAAHARRMP